MTDYNATEKRVGLPLQPPYQCRLIDESIDSLNEISRLMHDESHYDADILLEGLQSDLETIRTALEDVRAWGASWKTKALTHMET